MNIPVLYDDIHLAVCVKPRGVLSQSDSHGGAAMPELLAAQVGGTVYPVHRLDKEVSGVMVYAKTSAAAAKLSQLVSDHERFVKIYYAVVEGTPAPSGEMRDLLFHDRFKNKTYVVDRMRGGVKTARLAYETIATLPTEGDTVTSLVKIRIFTGRSHQIRVQFATRGFPLVGDKRYGARLSGDLALFSHSLTFPHPLLKKEIGVTAPPPTDGVWARFSSCFQQ